METKTSVIIINYNTKDVTLNCLKSLIKHTKGVEYEVIVVDNGSAEKFLIPNFRSLNVRLIRSKRNLGFAGGNNLGIRKARGEYILLLNSDTIIDSNVVGEMTGWMDRHREVGVATCKLKNPDGTVQGTGGYFPTLLRVFSWMSIEDIPGVDRIIAPFHPKPGHYAEQKDLDWVTGAYMFIRRRVIEEVGSLDTDYFMYTEDTDFCYRAKKAGWKVKYLPRWSIVHLGGASSRRGYPIVSEFENIKLFYKKHYPRWQYGLLRLFLKLGAGLRMICFAMLNRREEVRTYACAFKAA